MESPPSAPSDARPRNVTRRQLLRLVVVSALGAGIVLGVRGTTATGPPTQRVKSKSENASVSSTEASTSLSIVSSSGALAGAPAPEAATAEPSASQEVKLKAAYFQMPLVVGTKEEYFALAAPAHYADLLAIVVEKHPAISPMLPSMMVLIDGVPAASGTLLRDGDEVDFIPAVAGG